MNSPTSQELSKAFSIWYYELKDDNSFNPENPSDEHEVAYKKILEEVMSKPQ
jgi:hypothetical protein